MPAAACPRTADEGAAHDRASVVRASLVCRHPAVAYGSCAATRVLIGALGAAAAVRLLESLLHGVSAGDPLTFGAVALLVAAIALVASYVPARRALRIDPAETLRAD